MMLEKIKSLFKLGTSLALSTIMISSATAQCDSWEAFPSGAQSAREQHVIYRDMFKSKKYEEAFPTWQKLFAHVKSPVDAKSRHFKDGIKMYKEFAKAETEDKAKKKEFTDKMIALYDQMIGCLGENSLDFAWKGYNVYSLRGDTKLAIQSFEKSVELGKNKTHNMVLVPLAQLTVFKFLQGKDTTFTPEYMRKIYDTLKVIAEDNIKNNVKEGAKYQQKWDKVEAEFKKIGDKIWGCDFHVSEWKPIFEGDKMNMEQNAQILKLLKNKCGVENELYLEVLALYTPWKQIQDDSIAEANFGALCNLQKGKFQERKSVKAKKAGNEKEADSLKVEAFEWYEKSLEDVGAEGCEATDEEKGELAYRIADGLYREGSYSKARSLCNKAASLKKNWGKPYMLIGTMYASSGKRCSGGKGSGWDAQVVAWAAMDMWSKAKSVDSSVGGEANKKIGKYKKYLPTKGDIFQRGLKEGASYKIGCWIGVTTTIRAGGEG
jgi:hypothetical protein